MSNKTEVTTGGISFPGLLTIVFIVLKLMEIIEWPWFWVLSPLIFTTAIAVLIILGALILAFISHMKS